MAGLFSRLNPFPKLPPYSGPFTVGSTDVEIPVSELGSSLEAPDPTLTTIQFRIFYPCQPGAKHTKPIHWLPDPEHVYQAGFTKFLGIGPKLATALSYTPSIFKFTSLPAVRDAPIQRPQGPSKQWPLFIFSHGLGGTRSMYSHILGSVASHGFVTVAIEHRDGSAATAVMHSDKSPLTVLPYKKFPFERTDEIETARNLQLRIRLWECALLFRALEKLNKGEVVSNILGNDTALSSQTLENLKGQLDIDTPGSVAWCGHSFGAATILQFTKSIFYHDGVAAYNNSLFQSVPSESLARQITSRSPVILLDLWSLPIEANSTRALFEKPLPFHELEDVAESNFLCIISETFRKWRGNFEPTCRLLSGNPAVSAPSSDPSDAKVALFYVQQSAHLSQSDIGILFPALTSRFMQAPEPERILELNIKAIVQVLNQAQTRLGKRDPETVAESFISPVKQARGWHKLDLTDSKILDLQSPLKDAESVAGLEALNPSEKETEL